MTTSVPIATIWNAGTGESTTIDQTRAENIVRTSRGEWSFAKPLPAGWDREIPMYRASVDLSPPAFPRYRTENPLTSMDNATWQYAERPVAAGEIIETTSWPAASMVPINHSAKAVREFFTSRQKSRLPLSPWRKGKLHLDDGLSGSQPVLRPNLPTAATMPQPVRVAR
jgi:hypothetical protein